MDRSMNLKKVLCQFVKFFIIGISFLTLSCSKEESAEAPLEITLNKNELFLEIGKSERLIAAFEPFDAPNLAHTWNSSNPQIASVDETGNVTGVGVGEAMISAKALVGGKTATCKVTVTEKIVPVTGITLDVKELEIIEGETKQIVATVMPSNATNKSINWKSENNEIALVDNDGNVNAISAGQTKITATTVDGEYIVSCQISVIAKGVKFSLPEVENITSNTVVVKGTITANGVEISEMGICYSTTQNPTIEHTKIESKNENVHLEIKSLQSKTKYYVRLYAIVDGTVKYSDQTVFDTLTDVDFTSPTFINITSSSVNVVGTINSNGSALSESGIVYSTHSLPTIADNKVSISDENIDYTLYELQAGTTYYVRLYAMIGDVVFYSSENLFETLDELRTNFEAMEIGENMLRLVSNALDGYEKVNICYGTNPNPKVTDNVKVAELNSEGKLEVVLTDLSNSGSTVYYVRSYEKVGSTFKYNDDEISAMTIWEGREHSPMEERCSFKKTRSKKDSNYYISYSYKNLPEGTYEIKESPYSYEYIKFSNSEKGTYVDMIYIKGGSGSFYVKSYSDERGIILLSCVESGKVYRLSNIGAID